MERKHNNEYNSSIYKSGSIEGLSAPRRRWANAFSIRLMEKQSHHCPDERKTLKTAGEDDDGPLLQEHALDESKSKM